MDEEEHRRNAESFGAVAEVYEASRPGYPAEAVAWLAPGQGARVVDVGAGTGKFTEALIERGHTVVAVDPSEQMLDQLRRRRPDADTRIGTGEEIPLPDGWADVVTVAQAWHWVDSGRGSTEVARVLRPGGSFALIWNFRDDRVDWVRELGIAMRADGDSTAHAGVDPDVRAPFGEPERLQVGWTQPLTRSGLLDLVRSRSYVAVMSDDERTSTLAAVQDLMDTHPELTGRETFELPYVAMAFRYRRP